MTVKDITEFNRSRLYLPFLKLIFSKYKKGTPQIALRSAHLNGACAPFYFVLISVTQ